MNSREEQSLKIELDPRSAVLVPTMVVTIVGSVSLGGFRLGIQILGGFFSSVCLTPRKHLFGNPDKWRINVSLIGRQ